MRWRDWARRAGCFLAVVPLTGWLLLGTGPAKAETTAKDIQVMLKTIGFLTSKPRGAVTVAVIFDPANAESRKDGESIKAFLDAASGLAIVPVAKLVGLDQLNGVDGPAAVIAAGVAGPGLDAVIEAVKGRNVLTISTDPACARTGKCVMSIHAEPSVEILFNAAAARASGVEFLPNFRMMITQV
jgi:hypothetical protein